MKKFIAQIVSKYYEETTAKKILQGAYILQYLDNKTKSVDRSAKARGSFESIYAIYVLIEDYIKHGYTSNDLDYSKYEGMKFTDALIRTRELPFGEKIENHALNSRCNDEFKKFFNNRTTEIPIIRNLTTKRYWINEKLLTMNVDGVCINLAKICIEIIDKYVELKKANFTTFFDELIMLKDNVAKTPQMAATFISELLTPLSDARVFEIVSYVIVKYHFIEKTMTYSIDGHKCDPQKLTVYKTGRTNANDGGIDYIMLPLGRIFQVTEVLDFKKYFLDIDKLIHYPITFVIKQNISPEEALSKIRENAITKYTDKKILNDYMNCFEEIITIPVLKNLLKGNIENGHLIEMVDELIHQCKVEYNIDQ